jgi:aminodeoxyfutalosine synthase
MTVSLDDIGARISDGLPLTGEDARALASSYDIVSLGMMADEVRRRRHGRQITFLRVAEVSADSSIAAETAWPPAASEIRLVGRFPGLEQAKAIVASIAGRTGAAVSGFSLADIAQAADSAPSVVEEWLRTLGAAGLASVAEAPVDVCRDPIGMVRAARAAGVPIARLTVDAHGAGGVLSTIDRFLPLLSEGLVTTIAPLARRPGSEPTTGYADVKAVALARILLDVPHIQVDWALHGPKLAQVALTFGADDIDNVSAHDEVAEGRRRAPLEEIRRNIRAASLDPVERDARFVVLE